MVPMISRPENQYGLTTSAHKLRQGGRDAYYFTLDLATLDGILPQRVDDTVVREANRRLTPSHAKSIQEYLETRDDWLLGAMMLGIASDALEFEPYENEQGELYSENFGELRIQTKRLNTMRMFDGQHRRRAIQDALACPDKLASLEKNSVPIVLYAEDDIKALRLMFVDASKTKRIEGNAVTRFDQRDPFNLAAVHLADKSRLFGGRVEMERTTVVKRSQSLIAINQLAQALKVLEVGHHRRVSRARNDTYMSDLDNLYGRCLTWADEFMPTARREYADLLSGEIKNDKIPSWRVTSLAYSPAFMRILAGCYHDWIAENADWRPLAAFLQEASLEPGSSHGLLVDAGVVPPQGTSLISRRQEEAEAIRYIVQEAKEADRLTDESSPSTPEPSSQTQPQDSRNVADHRSPE